MFVQNTRRLDAGTRLIYIKKGITKRRYNAREKIRGWRGLLFNEDGEKSRKGLNGNGRFEARERISSANEQLMFDEAPGLSLLFVEYTLGLSFGSPQNIENACFENGWHF